MILESKTELCLRNRLAMWLVFNGTFNTYSFYHAIQSANGVAHKLHSKIKYKRNSNTNLIFVEIWFSARTTHVALPTSCTHCYCYHYAMNVSAYSTKIFTSGKIDSQMAHKARNSLLNTDVAPNMKLAINGFPDNVSWHFSHLINSLTAVKFPDRFSD